MIAGAKCWLVQSADIPLEVVILLLGGLALLIAGILLFPVSGGWLTFYENGLHGLLLVFFALQVITLGKTPFGDMRRSKLLVAAGIMIAAVGMTACFIPVFRQLPRILLFLCFGPGGLLLLARLCLAKDKFRAWAKYGGIFNHLILGCTLAYVCSILVAGLVWRRSLSATPAMAAAVLVYGVAIVYLAGVLRKIYGLYPPAGNRQEGDAGLDLDQSMILLMGVFMLLLGVLLVPVNLGWLPFSGSAQLGLLMVMFAVQMLASGSTPIGPYPRTGLIIVLGLLCAALGIVACIIPGILVPALTLLVGVLNILGGAASLMKICLPLRRQSDAPHGTVPPVLKRLFRAQLTMSLLTIMFGASMLVPRLIPGLIIGVILAADGGVLLYLLHILIVLKKINFGTRCQTCCNAVKSGRGGQA